tara:strand:+ start:719 stop:1288 length:570 start_codon:yes stop_codon:yes gene_type:complete
MGMYVPGMQQRFTGYDAGKNIANNLLEAVKMNREFEHKDNVMQMEQQKLDMVKESYALDQQRNKANMYVAKTREAHAPKEAEYLKYNRERQAYGEKKETDWYRWNPFMGESDYRDEYDEKHGGPPDVTNPKYAKKFEELGVLPDDRYLPEDMQVDTKTRTSDETLNALYGSGLMNNYGGSSHYATFDED